MCSNIIKYFRIIFFNVLIIIATFNGSNTIFLAVYSLKFMLFNPQS